MVHLAFDKYPNTPILSFSTSAMREETRVHPMMAPQECASTLISVVPIKVLPGFHKSIDVIP